MKETPVGDPVEVDIDKSAPAIVDCDPEDDDPGSGPVEPQDYKVIKVKASQLQQQPSEPSGQVPSHLVLLDNQAEVSIFRNKDLLTNLREADTHCHISGIVSDDPSSVLISTEIGDFQEFGSVYYLLVPTYRGTVRLGQSYIRSQQETGVCGHRGSTSPTVHGAREQASRYSF